MSLRKDCGVGHAEGNAGGCEAGFKRLSLSQERRACAQVRDSEEEKKIGAKWSEVKLAAQHMEADMGQGLRAGVTPQVLSCWIEGSFSPPRCIILVC